MSVPPIEPDTLLTLYRIARAANEAITPQRAYEVILEEVKRLFQPLAASISLISPNNSLLEKEYAIGYPETIAEMSMHLGKGLTGRVAFSGTPLLCPDVTKDRRYVKLIKGVRSKIVAPLVANGLVIGTIDVDRAKPNAFTPQDLETLLLIAEEATRSLQSVWQQNQLDKQSKQLKALIEVGHNIVSNLNVKELWETVAEAALQLTRAKFCTLQLYDAKSGRVQTQTAKPDQPHYLAKSGAMQPSECLAGSAIRTKRQVEFTNITTPDYRDLRDVPRHANLVSCLSTPMIYEDQVIGIINVFTDNLHRFANNELRLLQAFASLSAVAAQNADLYARVFNSEERLRKSERLTTLGLLSAEIAHEIRNPLTVIKLLFSSLGLDYPEIDPRHKDMKIIGEKLDQLEEIVSKVLSFGKAPEGIFTHWDADELIADTCLLVRHKMNQNKIDIEHLPLKKAPMVNGNKGQLQQVILNLIINAAEAMPDGGNMKLYARSERHADRPCVAIYVEDTGTGIPDHISDKIFDSFLTGKPEGTGLGLSIVKRILRSHHGDISVAKTGSEGTIMRIELPATSHTIL